MEEERLGIDHPHPHDLRLHADLLPALPEVGAEVQLAAALVTGGEDDLGLGRGPVDRAVVPAAAHLGESRPGLASVQGVAARTVEHEADHALAAWVHVDRPARLAAPADLAAVDPLELPAA